MKTYLFLLVSTFLLFSNKSISQTDLKYEIDISLISVTPAPSIFWNSGHSVNVLNNIQFKINTDKLDYRFSVGTNGYKVTEVASTQAPTAVGSVKEYQFAVGVSKKLLNRRFSPYIGIDFMVSRSHFDGNISSCGIVGCYSYDTKENEMAFGLAPVLGIQYQISSRLSVTCESSVQFLRSNVKRTSVDVSGLEPPQETVITESTNNNTVFVPLSRLSINYHF